MKIKFWGVRGSIPTPLSSSDVYDKITNALNLATAGDLRTEETKKNSGKENVTGKITA